MILTIILTIILTNSLILAIILINSINRHYSHLLSSLIYRILANLISLTLTYLPITTKATHPL